MGEVVSNVAVYPVKSVRTAGAERYFGLDLDHSMPGCAGRRIRYYDEPVQMLERILRPHVRLKDTYAV